MLHTPKVVDISLNLIGCANMFENYSKGWLAEIKFLEKCSEKGWNVAKPIVEDRYDYILDHPEKGLLKIQVKYCDSINKKYGTIVLDLRKETRRNGKVKLYSSSEIDAIVVYIPSKQCLLWLNSSIIANKNCVSIREEQGLKGSKKALLIKEYIFI